MKHVTLWNVRQTSWYNDVKLNTDSMETTLIAQRPSPLGGSVQNYSLIPTPVAWVRIEKVKLNFCGQKNFSLCCSSFILRNIYEEVIIMYHSPLRGLHIFKKPQIKKPESTQGWFLSILHGIPSSMVYPFWDGYPLLMSFLGHDWNCKDHSDI